MPAVTTSLLIDAPPDRVLEVVSDLENTDRWANEAQEARVTERGGDGRPSVIAVTLGAIGFRTTASYAVAYTASTITLTCVSGNLIHDSVIRYTATAEGGRTNLEMSSTMEVSVPVPAWGLRRAMRTSAEKNLRSVQRDAERAA